MCTSIHNNFWCIHNLEQFLFQPHSIYFKDTHTEKNTLKKNSNALEKYEYGHFDGWYIKSALYTRFLNWNKIFEKGKYLVTGKTPFFVIGPFCTPHAICLNIGFWQSSFAVLYGNVMLPILVLSTKKTVLQVFKKGLRFSENLFQKY